MRPLTTMASPTGTRASASDVAQRTERLGASADVPTASGVVAGAVTRACAHRG